MPQLDFYTYPSQILWFLISFGVLFFASYFLVVPKIERAFSRRVSYIGTDIDSALAICSASNLLLTRKMEIVESANLKAERIIEEALETVGYLESSVSEMLKHEVKCIIQSSEEMIKDMRSSDSMSDFVDLAEGLVLLYLKNVLGVFSTDRNDVVRKKVQSVLIS